MDDQVVQARLRRFGLSEKQASTYLTLLGLGDATAGELSDATGISKGYVYEIMRELDDLGMATLNDGMTPTTIRPKPPEETVDEFVTEITSIQDELQSRYTASTREAPEIDIVKSRQTSFKRLRELISHAHKEVMIMVPGPALPELADALEKAMDRGAVVFLLLGDTDSDDADPVVQARDCAHVARRWEQRGHSFTLAVDDRSSMLGDPNLLHGEHRDDDNGIVVRNSPKTTGSIISLTANFWAEGTETFVAEPPALPVTVESVRAAVVFATLHRRAGQQVAIDATVEDGDGERVRGRIVEISQGMLAPATSDFPLENSFLVTLEDGRTVTVGGARGFVEDYAATEFELLPAGTE